ncbi:4-hydroxyphenylacetate decarboxylase small subunit [Inediibacterium massiliense]|uniref:4-hydroxyphenylacetate decarboxylase small subunit n=1 Tax=Inediibacterium massiliense TaxID=1658111 RepID=UPI001FA79156|nr:4-hydroxyphenylacetate decarboxylase small subunit [Inediibacterium massiliense]
MNKFRHNDCINFSPIDAAKGICRLANTMINIDGNVCNAFKEAPKCRNCHHFKDPDEDEIGICKGLDKEDWTFGDLHAMTCTKHIFKK